MRDIQSLLQLKFYYYEVMFGQKYVNAIEFEPHKNTINSQSSLYEKISHCLLCERSKIERSVYGMSSKEAKIIFVTPLPLISHSSAFLSNNSSKMFQDIINNVFKLNVFEYDLFSLIKCNPNEQNISSNQALVCKPYLIEQISKSSAKMVILMGESILSHLFGLDFMQYKGQIFRKDDKEFIATYELNELLKNPSLKKEAMQHFLNARANKGK